VLVSIGMGLCMVPLTTTAVAGVAHHEAGLASGLVNVSRLFGGALGLALLVAIADAYRSDLLARGSISVAAATSDGFARGFLASSGIALAGALLVLPLVRRARPIDREITVDVSS